MSRQQIGEDGTDLDLFDSEGQDSCQTIPPQVQNKKFGKLQGGMSKPSNGKKMRPSSASILKTKSQLFERQLIENLKFDARLQQRPAAKDDDGTKSVRFASGHLNTERNHHPDEQGSEEEKNTPSVTYAFQPSNKDDTEKNSNNAALIKPEPVRRKPRPMSAAVKKQPGFAEKNLIVKPAAKKRPPSSRPQDRKSRADAMFFTEAADVKYGAQGYIGAGQG